MSLALESLHEGFQLHEHSVYPSRNVIIGPIGEQNIEPKAMQVLLFLASQPNVVIPRNEFMEQVWPGTVIGEEVLTRCISLLRSVLKKNNQHNYIETVSKSGYRLVAPVKALSINKDDSADKNISRKPTRIINGLALFVTVFLIIIAGYYYKTINHLVTKPSSDISETVQVQAEEFETKINKVMTLAVLPLVNLSNDKEQEYFVDGLTEELINSLTQIKGLKVIGRTSSFAFKGKNIDLREIAKQLNVEYLVEGSVRKSDENLRITVQLIEAESGTHILSKTFDRKLVNIFALQEEISNQVAAALKLSLIHKDDRYNSALSTLDYIAVEQLVSARALINERAEAPVMEAYNTLVDLNKKYPDTPEIMGLIAFAAMMHSSYGKPLLTIKQEIELAEQTLKLDRKNADALSVLAVIYDDHPQTYQQAYILYQDLIRFYPANPKVYVRMVVFLTRILSSCEEIQTFLNTVPDGVFSSRQKQQYDFMVMHCLTPELAEDKLLSMPDKTIADLSLESTSHYYSYLAIKKLFTENPNQRYISGLYFTLLSMGADESAATLSKQIDYSNPGYWPVYNSLYAYMFSVSAPKKPLDLMLPLEKMLKNSTLGWVAIGLSKQAYFEERTEEIKTYLDNVPKFPIGIDTLDYSFGLMLLQFYSGESDLSRQTALQLFNELTEYKTNYPASFEYWNLADYYLPLTFYSGNENLALTILNENFKEAHIYWGFTGYEPAEFIYNPWKEHFVAIEYLQRIQKDQQRARKKFNLK